jgi:vitamin B12 transporter
MKVALLALVLAAQQPQDTVVLNPVVVTGTRVPIRMDRLSSAVTVLRGNDLIADGIRTVADALELVAGATVLETGSYGGQTSLFMRGGESDYVKVLLDGVSLNQPGGGIDLADLTIDNIDRIEVLRGPASVLYGSDAMTGVIQIFTKKGDASRARLGAELRVGTYGSSDAALDIAGGSARLSYSARLSRFFSDGLYSYNNTYRNSIASVGVKFAPDARSDVNLTYRYGDDIYHIPTDGRGAPVDSNQRAAEHGPLFSVGATRSFSPHWEARVGATLREARLFYNDEPDSPGEDGTFWSKDWVRRAGGNALLTWRNAEALALTAGIEYEDQRQRGSSEFSASFGTFPNPPVDVQRSNVGYFTQAILSVGQAAVTVGGRFDDNSQFGSHSTYRAGLGYRLSNVARLRFSAGSGFKEPSFFENYATGFVRGNRDLDPERSRSWEAGIEYRGVSVTYFSQEFRDLIEFSATPLLPDSVNYFNVGAATANGIETSIAAQLSPAVAFSLRYTYLHTRVDESGSPNNPDGLFVPGKPLIRRPAHTVSPELTANSGRVHVMLGGRWVGSRDDLDFARPVGQQRVTLEPYARVNLAADYDLDRFVLSGRIDNLFNDQTQEIAGYRPRGRTVLIGGRFALGL